MREELGTLLAIDWNIYTEILLNSGIKSLGNIADIIADIKELSFLRGGDRLFVGGPEFF